MTSYSREDALPPTLVDERLHPGDTLDVRFGDCTVTGYPEGFTNEENLVLEVKT